jgi:hypothetical protein
MMCPAVNLVPAQYRSVSVANVPVPLDEQGLRGFLLGRAVYRRTRYLVARHGSASAVSGARHRGCQPGRPQPSRAAPSGARCHTVQVLSWKAPARHAMSAESRTSSGLNGCTPSMRSSSRKP